MMLELIRWNAIKDEFDELPLAANVECHHCREPYAIFVRLPGDLPGEQAKGVQVLQEIVDAQHGEGHLHTRCLYNGQQAYMLQA